MEAICNKNQISNEDQIRIIDIALSELKKQREDKGSIMSLRSCLAVGINDTLGVGIYYYYVSSFIPLFTRENALKHGGMPELRYREREAYWWSERNYRDRRKFLLWMRKELKTK